MMLKKRHYLLIATSVGSLLIIFNAYALTNRSFFSPHQLFAQAQPQTPENLKKTAQNITVRVQVGDTSGSGVLIAKNGQTYTVITNAHVVKRAQSYRIQTPDGTVHEATLQTAEDALTGNDLALLQFDSPNNYTLATFASSDSLKPDQPVLAAGFPYDSSEISISEGNISLITSKPITGGYQIGFSNPTEQGMSGGVLLNEQGELIGIIGKGNAILSDAYNYQDGTSPDANLLQQIEQANFAIPIEQVAFLAQLYNDQGQQSNIPRQVNQIAAKISVRIDTPTDFDGSGVIIGRNQQTYYVLTARHVVEGLTEFKIITPDGKSHQVNQEGIKTFEGVDIGVVEFTSAETYQVATLADYPLGQFKQKGSTLDIVDPLVFVSGFPIVKSGKPTRKFTTGTAYPQTLNLQSTKDQYSLTQGLELVYSALSLPGMSGGAVLDQQGRVIGINAGAEHEEIRSGEQAEEVLYFGNSLGVPIRTFLGQLEKANINSQWFKVEANAPQPLSNEQINQILESLFTQKPPTKSSSAVEWFNYGRFQTSLDQNEKALEAYDQAIKRNPQLYQAYYAKGRALYSEEISQDAEALAAFEKATEVEPEFSLGWYWQAQVLLSLKKYSEALVAIDEAIQLQSEEPKSYALRGSILDYLERHPEAEEAYARAIQLKPNALTYLNRSYQRFNWQDYDGTIADATRAIELQPNLSNGYLFRANARLIGGFNIQAALQDANSAIKLDPDYPLFYQVRGTILTRMGDYQNAIADFDKVLQNSAQLQPENLINTYQLRGTVYSQLKEWDKALADATKVIELEPDNAEHYFNRGFINYFAEDQSQAIADLSEAIELNPDYADAYRLRGFIYFDNQDEAKGKEDLNQAIKLYTAKIEENPNNPINYTWRGFSRGRLGDKKGAEEDIQMSKTLEAQGINQFEEATNVTQELREKQKEMQTYYTQEIKQDPDNANLYFYRGIVAHNLRDYQSALADFNRSLELNSEHPQAYYRRGLTHQSLKANQKAIDDFTQALKLNIFEDATVHYQRGLVYAALQNYSQAIDDFTLVINRRPDYSDPYLKRGAIRADNQEYELALKDINQAIALHPNQAEMYFHRGVIYQKQGDDSKALADYQLAVEKDKNQIPAIINIAYIAYEKGEVEAALKLWEKATEINANLAEPKLAMAVVLYSQGDREKSLEMAQQALTLDKSWANVEHLKKNLWGDKLIAEAQKLLQNPEITAILNK
ncbi:MAG: tetratricopeptide repeat protein [Cyanobacteria bacterium P01_G01_bin.49]